MRMFSYWRSLATFRVRAALNLKGIAPEEIIEVNLEKGHQRDPKFRAVNPMMAIPALIDGDGPALFESMAIMEYLDEVHPKPPLLPADAKARARVRGISQIICCDSHPLTVPRVRNYLLKDLKLDEATMMKWCQHWMSEALGALESHLSGKETGAYCQGDQLTMADICVAGQTVGAYYFKVDLGPYPNVKRIGDTTFKNEAIARAHPLKQPGAPASV